MPSIASDQPVEEAIAQVLSAFMGERTPVYIVGGAVRDHLLGISSIPGWTQAAVTEPSSGSFTIPKQARSATTDLDLVLEGPVLPLARQVADRLGWAYYPLDTERDVARLIGKAADGQRIECDAAALRGDLKTDLLARDFTANALALALAADNSPKLIDICDGIGDIRARLLRRISSDSLRADPIRLLRAARLAAQLGFAIEEGTRAQIGDCAETVLSVSAERVRYELWKLLDCVRPDEAIRELNALGLLVHLFPEVEALQGVTQSSRHHLDAYKHSLLAARYAAELRDWLRGGPAPEDDALTETLEPWAEPLRAHFSSEIAVGRDRAGWLAWHALLHDTGKADGPDSDSGGGEERRGNASHQNLSARLAGLRVESLRFSRREVLLAERVASMHSLPRKMVRELPQNEEVIGARAAFRFFRDAGSVVAGHQSAAGFRSAGRPAPLDGLDVIVQAISDLQATGLARGPEWARFLKAIEGLFSYAFTLRTEQGEPLVDGNRLMERLGLRPGPQVGAIMRELAEAQAAGTVSSADEALALAEELMAKGAA